MNFLRALVWSGYGAVAKTVMARVASANLRAQDLNRVSTLSKKKAGVRRIWFHAASVGELESLWCVVLASAQKGFEVVLTVFSESARNSVERLAQEVQASGGSCAYWGFSPSEGGWAKAISTLEPDLFVTARYEAWPELWVALSRAGICLIVQCARLRGSLKFARSFCRILGVKPPKILFLTVLESESRELAVGFPDSRVIQVGEPRWDRVYQRSQSRKSRISELEKVFKDQLKPWGVLGSVWAEDLRFLKPYLSEVRSTLWVVPHKLDPKSVEEMEGILRSCDLTPVRTSEFESRATSPLEDVRICVLVDEMGLLLELYSLADWAFVGGGFGAGVHSTLEPAVYGIPIAAGPKNAEKFSEIVTLKERGQLRIVSEARDMGSWLHEVAELSSATKKEKWEEQVLERDVGATLRVLDVIQQEIQLRDLNSGTGSNEAE